MCCYVHMDVVPGAYVRELVVFDESLTFLDPLFFAAMEFNKHIIQTWYQDPNYLVECDDCETPKIYLRTLKEQPCAILYMVNASCRCSSVGLETITVSSFIIPSSVLHNMKLNVSLSIPRLSLNCSFFQVAYPSRQSFFCSSRSRFEIFCFFGRFWTVCKIPCVTIPTAPSWSPLKP